MPNCGYVETISVAGLPGSLYLTHSQTTRSFTIAQTNDYGFLGLYNVVIKSEFEQPNIYKVMDLVSKTISFTITVSPCIVTSYNVVSAPINSFTYILGDPSLKFGPYQF